MDPNCYPLDPIKLPFPSPSLNLPWTSSRCSSADRNPRNTRRRPRQCSSSAPHTRTSSTCSTNCNSTARYRPRYSRRPLPTPRYCCCSADAPRTPSPHGRSAPSTAPPCALARPHCGHRDREQAKERDQKKEKERNNGNLIKVTVPLLVALKLVSNLDTHRIDFTLVIPHVYIAVHQRLVHGDPLLGVHD